MSDRRPLPTPAPRPERILCAAILVDTGSDKPPRRTFSYPKTGLLFCGRRHPDCQTTLEAVPGIDRYPRTQGFLTSTGRFVGRVEALQIAKSQGQVADGVRGQLYSEDLY